MPFLRSRPELLAGFRRGDRETLATVYWEYVGRVDAIVRHGYAVAHSGRRISGARREEVQDLVQETFLRAFAERARLSYDGLRDYGPFLATIARNILTDWARKRGRELLLDHEPDEGISSEVDESLPWSDVETMKVVEDYLGSLDEDLRAIHRVRYEEGLSQEHAARSLGLTRQQLRTRETRLRDGLSRALRVAKRRE